ncbi:TonB-dependent receptor plug domain-containing protein [Maricaulis sp.]|uniref:TonB-dependent receptor plug domain-containing protein n=1 Tax=Maricaulis sp. TaxID=1486257 RepID=UPI003A8D490B
MSSILLHSASALALSCLTAMPALAQDASPLTDIITVSGQQLDAERLDRLDPATLPPSGPDAAALIARLPGATVVGNGVLSSQVQYRGLSGGRINLRIDGQNFASGGPNLMDPPLHYAPIALIERIEVDRSVSPVRSGPGLAGGVNAVFKQVGFGETDQWQTRYDLTLAGRTAGDSSSVGGVVGMANDQFRIQLLGSSESGDDINWPGGTIGGSAHERLVYGAGLGFRTGVHEFSLDLRRQETGATGNPPFAMDIRYFDTDFARVGYRGDWDGVSVTAHLAFADVAHAMNNYDLRPAPMMAAMYRESLATAQTVSGGGDAVFAALGGSLRLGFDGEQAEHDLAITNPNNANFVLNSLSDITMERTGAFAEWTGAVAGWESELGLRADRHRAEAGPASVGSAVPAMPGMLVMAFNATDRRLDDTTLDAVARLWRPVNDSTTLRLTFARKTRAPGYVERFAWLPTEASGGLADGNTYVGNADLAPETAWIAEAGLDWSSATAYARPTLFYRSVDDFIQGVPYDATPGVIDTPVEMVSAMNGDPTPLRFANTDARLYGLDLDFGVGLSAAWHLDGTASWVRGERRDIDDNLYRTAPPSLRLGLTREAAAWSATLETLAVARQDRVSAANSEAETPGYVLVNLYGSWTLREGVSLAAGVENLFDHSYRQHLAGYNRNAGSDVGLGERLPGTGRSLGLRLTLRG